MAGSHLRRITVISWRPQLAGHQSRFAETVLAVIDPATWPQIRIRRAPITQYQYPGRLLLLSEGRNEDSPYDTR